MTKRECEQRLDSANDIVQNLLQALANIQRATDIDYAHGAAEFAIAAATSRMTCNRHGYLDVRCSIGR